MANDKDEIYRMAMSITNSANRDRDKLEEDQLIEIRNINLLFEECRKIQNQLESEPDLPILEVRNLYWDSDDQCYYPYGHGRPCVHSSEYHMFWSSRHACFTPRKPDSALLEDYERHDLNSAILEYKITLAKWISKKEDRKNIQTLAKRNAIINENKIKTIKKQQRPEFFKAIRFWSVTSVLLIIIFGILDDMNVFHIIGIFFDDVINKLIN